MRRPAAEEPRANLAGLYDEGEEKVIRAALERAGYGPNIDRSGLVRVEFFACSADLEDELVRAAGEAILLRLIELEGDAQSWRTSHKQHAWQGRQADQQFRRFIRSVSDRNSRYIRTLFGRAGRPPGGCDAVVKRDRSVYRPLSAKSGSRYSLCAS